jgi:HEPN domain-containing protein
MNSTDEAGRWFKTAQGDLESARILTVNGKFAHACFHCQQASVKAMKAIWYRLDADPWGHSITKLVQDLEHVDLNIYKQLEPLKRCAVLLDRFYITTRYPNGLPDLTPDDTFIDEDAKACTENANRILEAAARLTT